MEEIIHAFGIDWRLIVIQMFNFMILGAALWYFLYTPVLKILSEREEKLKKGVLDADKAAQSLEDANREKTALLTTARKEAEGLVDEASRHAETKGSSIVKEAEERASRMIADAKMRAEEEMVLAQKASEAEIAKAAILAAEKILNQKQ
jgi:F-type H+-transporting ATPase subunit b